MSYLQFPRLAFFGDFQADASTVNNDPRHFDVGTFDPSYQQFREHGTNKDGYYLYNNGWWNPRGTGIMRFRECYVKSLRDQSGNFIGSSALDPLVGCKVGNALDSPSGKIVDLDPDWQFASNLYGLVVSITDTDGSPILVGDFEPNPFRDLWFARGAGNPSNENASAMFQSRLRLRPYSLSAIKSPFLKELLSATEDGYLSIRLTTYAFEGNVNLAGNLDNALNPRFGYGKLIGSIGPSRSDQPRSFILGRRFLPTTSNAAGDLASKNGIGCFSSFVDDEQNYFHVDLSNALPLNPTSGYRIANQGNLAFAVLHSESIKQDDSIESDQYTKLGLVDQTDQLQENEGGIYSLRLNPGQQKAMQGRPLAIVKLEGFLGNATVCVREVPNGIEVRPDTFAFKLDPNDGGENSKKIVLYATVYGEPLKNRTLSLSVGPKTPDTDNTPSNTPSTTSPPAPIPIYNEPQDGAQISPATPQTDQFGRAQVTLSGPTLMGTPRGYIDGQLYVIFYKLAGGGPLPQQPLDQIAVVVYSTFPSPFANQRIDVDNPTWADVQPILQQYANLYPVMSQGLFDFSKQPVADSAAFAMKFVFDKDINDPDHMPVTRDLSASKRRILINYFDNVIKNTGKNIDSQIAFGKRCPMRHFMDSEQTQSVTDVALTLGKKR
ncbi:hypothetical protein C0Z18_21305 [Trinickia dabaoshanensis]|uniref:Uncharacterized protein n=1 Tax=Trinickia dabaoshanensis TaxID=564714 RepID=A0A2N7VIM1_9BURK|nr:hypothetical protein [Trinickia dabaoshanensis]PMS17006.1 hypothetical protein C0Z18_21305 [Trinickia dabaoshanensis]